MANKDIKNGVAISKTFEKNLRKLYPYKSIYKATKELNKVLEKMIYDK